MLFSQDSMCSFSKNIDFAKICKSEISEVTFVFNFSKINKIYIVDWSNNAQINPVNFIMEKKISSTDTLFLKKILLQVLALTFWNPSILNLLLRFFTISILL